MKESFSKYNAENSASLKASDPQPSNVKGTRIFTSWCPKKYQTPPSRCYWTIPSFRTCAINSCL